MTLQFGFGTDENENQTIDPANVLVNQHGKKYISDDSFDPAVLIKTDSLGVVPSNTVLRVIYRVNTVENTNTSVGTITQVKDPIIDFFSELELDSTLVAATRSSLEVINERAFVGSNPLPTSEELRERAFGVYSMQNRIVTKQDLITAAYNMPKRFGSIAKAMAYQDTESFNQRNINLYVMATGADGKYQVANSVLKNNLKTHITRYKMINDTIDILDAKIINLVLNYRIIALPDVDQFKALDTSKQDLVTYFQNRRNYEIGEEFLLTDIFNVLKNSPLVLDVISVSANAKTGPAYADTNFNADNHISSDGRKINCPIDSIFEIKFPNTDIVGTIQ